MVEQLPSRKRVNCKMFPGSAPVPIRQLRSLSPGTLFGETPNSTRGDAYAPHGIFIRILAFEIRLEVNSVQTAALGTTNVGSRCAVAALSPAPNSLDRGDTIATIESSPIDGPGDREVRFRDANRARVDPRG